MKQGSKTAEQNQPMDPSAREAGQATGTITQRQRPCWAIKTLVKETHVLFPETPVEYSNVNGRNTHLDVRFDLSVLDPPDIDIAAQLLTLAETDKRIESVIVGAGDMTDQVLVSFRNDPRTYDLRDPFGLGDALDVLNDENEETL